MTFFLFVQFFKMFDEDDVLCFQFIILKKNKIKNSNIQECEICIGFVRLTGVIIIVVDVGVFSVFNDLDFRRW